MVGTYASMNQKSDLIHIKLTMIASRSYNLFKETSIIYTCTLHIYREREIKDN